MTDISQSQARVQHCEFNFPKAFSNFCAGRKVLEGGHISGSSTVGELYLKDVTCDEPIFHSGFADLTNCLKLHDLHFAGDSSISFCTAQKLFTSGSCKLVNSNVGSIAASGSLELISSNCADFFASSGSLIMKGSQIFSDASLAGDSPAIENCAFHKTLCWSGKWLCLQNTTVDKIVVQPKNVRSFDIFGFKFTRHLGENEQQVIELDGGKVKAIVFESKNGLVILKNGAEVGSVSGGKIQKP